MRKWSDRMRRVVAVGSFAVLAGNVGVGMAHGGTVPKVTICHLPPGNRSNVQVITVGASAVRAHLAHGDLLPDCAGICGGPTQVDCAGICGGPTQVDCAGVCDGPNTECNDQCTDTSTDPSNCGGCSNACAPGGTCINGQCSNSLQRFCNCIDPDNPDPDVTCKVVSTATCATSCPSASDLSAFCEELCVRGQCPFTGGAVLPSCRTHFSSSCVNR